MTFVETTPPKKYMKAKPRGMAIAEMTKVRITLSSRANVPRLRLRMRGLERTGTTYVRIAIEPMRSRTYVPTRQRNRLRIFSSLGHNANLYDSGPVPTMIFRGNGPDSRRYRLGEERANARGYRPSNQTSPDGSERRPRLHPTDRQLRQRCLPRYYAR